jgi:hypothetical protein
MNLLLQFKQFWTFCEQVTLAARFWTEYARQLASHGIVAGITYLLLVGVFLAPFFVASPKKRGHKLATQIAASALKKQVPTAAANVPLPAAEVETIEPPDDVLELPSDHTIRLARLDVEDHVTIRGTASHRAVVILPKEGLAVTREDLTFENIDFFASEGNDEPIQPTALLRVSALEATFRNCTFHGNGCEDEVAAIEWRLEESPADAACRPRLRIDESTFSHLGQGIRLNCKGCWEIVCSETAVSDLGAFIHCQSFPFGAESGRIELSSTTITETTCAMQLAAADWQQPGRIQAVVKDSRFLVLPTGALLRVGKGADLFATLSHFEWTGSGSTCGANCELAQALDDEAEPQPIEPDMLDIGGLVYGEVSPQQPDVSNESHAVTPVGIAANSDDNP